MQCRQQQLPSWQLYFTPFSGEQLRVWKKNTWFGSDVRT